MPNNNDNAKFYQRRRQFMDEILFAKELRPVEKLLGLAMAQVSDRDNGGPADSTFKGVAWFAEHLGIDGRIIRNADQRLQDGGRIKLVKDGSRAFRICIRKHDAPIRSTTNHTKKFYSERSKYIEGIVFDLLLTPAQRLVAIADTCFDGREPLSEIAKFVGIARKTAYRLASRTRDITRDIGRDIGRDIPSHQVPRKDSENRPNLGNLGNLGNTHSTTYYASTSVDAPKERSWASKSKLAGPSFTSAAPASLEGLSSHDVEAVLTAIAYVQRADVGAILGFFRDNPDGAGVLPRDVARILKATGLRRRKGELTQEQYDAWNHALERLREKVAA
jgi:hypothetical protein